MAASQKAIAVGIIATMALSTASLAVVMFKGNANYRGQLEEKRAAATWARGSGGVEPLELTAAPGLERGKEIYSKVCIACHGPTGGGMRVLNSPALNGQEDWYLRAQMAKFREGVRGRHPEDITGMQMQMMLQPLPDPQCYDDLAAYIVTLSAPPMPPEVQGDIARGKSIYEAVCVECHGPDALGLPEKKSPALAGQNDWYVAIQLRKFRDGIRGAHPRDITGAEMRAKSITLEDDQACDDLAAYIATMGR